MNATSAPDHLSPQHLAVSTSTLRLYSWNVNGIRATIKKGLWDWMMTESPDILGLQETKISSDQLTLDMTQRLGYQSYWSHAEKKGYSGVAIYTKIPPINVTEGLGIERFDREGRVLVAEYDRFYLYVVYFPNGQRDAERLQYKLDFYQAFIDHANALQATGKPVVFCGDVNTAHHPIDLARPKANETTSGFLPIERAWMDRVVEAGYIDTFRHLNPTQTEAYSWWNMRAMARERNVGWRIDYFFISPHLLPHLAEARIHPDVMGSDHCPVSLTLMF